MKKLIFILILLSVTPAFAGKRAGVGAPAEPCYPTYNIGETYTQTDATAGANLWVCSSNASSGSWVQQGGGGVGAITATQIPQANSSHALVNSGCTSDGAGNETCTSVTASGAVTAGSIVTSPAGGVGGGFVSPEGTVPATIAGVTVPQAGYDACYADSTTHATLCSYNNLAFGSIPLIIGTLHITGLTATESNQVIVTAPGAGRYQVCGYAVSTTGQASCQITSAITYTNPGGVQAPALWAASGNFSTTAGDKGACLPVYIASANISINATVSNCTPSTLVYELDAWVTRIP